MYKNNKSCFDNELFHHRTNKQKESNFLSVFLSQAITGADILIILFFTKILSNSYISDNILIVDQILNMKAFYHF